MNGPDGSCVIAAANPKPCTSCPWLTANHGMPHPHGWFTTANRKRLWAALRRGEMMSCHKTDPDNIVPEGGKPVPEGTQPHECTGGLILQQRELMKFQVPCGPFDRFQAYRRDHAAGLTKDGARRIIERAVFGGVPMIGGTAMTKPDLNQDVSHPPLGEWDPNAV